MTDMNPPTAPAGTRYRLVTRSDFDGLVCAALLKELGMLDDILFVHPKDVQDGKVELTGQDITTNLPWRPEVHLPSITTAPSCTAFPTTPRTG